MQKIFLLFSGISGALAVMLGALGAHSLQELITVEQLQSYETGVRYQMFHTLAIVLVVLLYDKLQSKHLKYAVWLFVIGIILFSGSIYLLSTQDITGLNLSSYLWPVTPLGGIFFVIGWLFIFTAAWKMSPK